MKAVFKNNNDQDTGIQRTIRNKVLNLELDCELLDLLKEENNKEKKVAD